mmetsp:Transcript_15478/g.38126  ORF Transcript_15478/g.38126 Transcript_15478/m.38126 type:complete len:182 (-) Transcript_15478:786-1331(-)
MRTRRLIATTASQFDFTAHSSHHFLSLSSFLFTLALDVPLCCVLSRSLLASFSVLRSLSHSLYRYICIYLHRSIDRPYPASRVVPLSLTHAARLRFFGCGAMRPWQVKEFEEYLVVQRARKGGDKECVSSQAQHGGNPSEYQNPSSPAAKRSRKQPDGWRDDSLRNQIITRDSAQLSLLTD